MKCFRLLKMLYIDMCIVTIIIIEDICEEVSVYHMTFQQHRKQRKLRLQTYLVNHRDWALTKSAFRQCI